MYVRGQKSELCGIFVLLGDSDVFLVCKEQSPKIQPKDASDIWNLYKATKGWQFYSCYPQKQIHLRLLLREQLQISRYCC